MGGQDVIQNKIYLDHKNYASVSLRKWNIIDIYFYILWFISFVDFVGQFRVVHFFRELQKWTALDHTKNGHTWNIVKQKIMTKMTYKMWS